MLIQDETILMNDDEWIDLHAEPDCNVLANSPQDTGTLFWLSAGQFVLLLLNDAC